MGHASWRAENGEIAGKAETPDGGWLVLEYLEGTLRIHAAPAAAMAAAAAWAGAFHAFHEGRRDALPFLKVYDAAYYTGWARRVRR